MPEGPEIRREADLVAAAVEGDTLEEVYFGLPRLKPYTRIFTGSRISCVETRGKAMLIHFDNGYSLYSHNQLYGKWYTRKAGDLPETNRTLRVALHTLKSCALLYSASSIEVLETAAVARHPFIAKLGPDILDPDLSWRDVTARLTSKPMARRKLAALYLDQSFMAGIGNYLRSEILFDAGVSPHFKPWQLSRAELGRLARSTLSISRRAYDTGGVTNAPAVVKALKRDGAARRYYRFAVFARDGLPCYRCGAEIERITATSRRLYFCPTCQSCSDSGSS